MTVQDQITPHQQEAQDKYKSLLVHIHNEAKTAILIAKTAKEIRDKKLYRYLGEGGYDTWSQFLADPDIGKKPSTIRNYIRTYEYYTEVLEISEEELLSIPFYRLLELAGKLRQKENKEAKEIISSVGTMHHSDYRREIKEQGLEAERPHVFIHENCGNWKIKIPEGVEMCKCDEQGIANNETT